MVVGWGGGGGEWGELESWLGMDLQYKRAERVVGVRLETDIPL